VENQGSNARNAETVWITRGIFDYADKLPNLKRKHLAFTQADRYAEAIKNAGGIDALYARKLPILKMLHPDLSVSAIAAVDGMDEAARPKAGYSSDSCRALMRVIFSEQDEASRACLTYCERALSRIADFSDGSIEDFTNAVKSVEQSLQTLNTKSLPLKSFYTADINRLYADLNLWKDFLFTVQALTSTVPQSQLALPTTWMHLRTKCPKANKPISAFYQMYAEEESHRQQQAEETRKRRKHNATVVTILLIAGAVIVTTLIWFVFSSQKTRRDKERANEVRAISEQRLRQETERTQKEKIRQEQLVASRHELEQFETAYNKLRQAHEESPTPTENSLIELKHLQENLINIRTRFPQPIDPTDDHNLEVNKQSIDNLTRRLYRGPFTAVDWQEPTCGIAFKWISVLNMWAGKYEITNEQFRKYRASHYYDAVTSANNLDGPTKPVVLVSWGDAAGFARWLTDHERKAARLWPGLCYRLPTSAEWTRIAANKTYPWGDAFPPTHGNYSPTVRESCGYEDLYPYTCSVEQSGENSLGIFGLAGNASEWVADSVRWTTLYNSGGKQEALTKVVRVSLASHSR
jgi:hypothetical protein